MKCLGKIAILGLIMVFSFGAIAQATETQAPAAPAGEPQAAQTAEKAAPAAPAAEKKAPESTEWLPPCSPPPLPLFGIEGYDGVALTYSAYLMNPCTKPGQVFSYPNVGAGFLVFPTGRMLTYFQVSETLWDRIGISYAFDTLGIDSLREDIQNTTGIDIGQRSVRMHNINGRVVLLKENQFGQNWLPQLTFGTHWKYNEDERNINNSLKVPGLFPNGVLADVAGITKNSGWEFTLYASKMLTFLPRPVLLNFGVRNSDAAQIGLLGFTNHRRFLFEGNVIVFVTNRFLLSGEFRQNPNNFANVNVGGKSLIGGANNYWSFAAAYLFSTHFSMSAAFVNMGRVLNEHDNAGFALKAKYQF
jgi:hypothetical protein